MEYRGLICVAHCDQNKPIVRGLAALFNLLLLVSRLSVYYFYPASLLPYIMFSNSLPQTVTHSEEKTRKLKTSVEDTFIAPQSRGCVCV